MTEELQRSRKKVIADAIFVVIVFGITFYLLFKDQEVPGIIRGIKKANKGYLVFGLMLALSFVCGESVIIKILLHTLKTKVSLIQCLKYGFVGFFFSAVTPSASGGQPMQVLWMKRDGIGVGESTVSMMVITILFKLVIIFLGIGLFLTQSDFISSAVGNIWFLLSYGVICNVVFICFLLFAVFKTSWLTGIIGKAIFWLGRHHMIRNREKLLRRCRESFKRYNNSASYLVQNKKVIAICFLITIIQRICLFSIPYVVYKAFGLSGFGYFEILALQIMIALAVDSLPLPGGVGATESSFLVVFLTVFGDELVMPGMLLSRGISYYVLLMISALILCGAKIIEHRKKGRLVGDHNDRIL